jgi:hypothetical protein
MRNGKATVLKATVLKATALKATALVATATLAATVGMFSPRPAAAAEPAHFAVMGVRLYMSAQEVLAALYAQGVREDGISEHVHPCALHAAAACTDSITARLVDGPITVRFADAPPGFNEGREAAFSIVYRLTRAPANAADMRDVAEERFGPLSDAADGAWCAPGARTTAGAPACPEDRPRMSYRNGHSGGELALTDLGLKARLTQGVAQ